MIRIIAVVVAGYLVFAVPAGLLFAVTGRDPHAAAPAVFVIVSTVYGMIFAGLGAYLATRLAAQRPRAHAMAVAVLIGLGALVSLLATRAAGGAIWSQIGALVFMAPTAASMTLLRRRPTE